MQVEKAQKATLDGTVTSDVRRQWRKQLVRPLPESGGRLSCLSMFIL